MAVELDENGKPCRTCNSLTDFQQAMFGKPSATSGGAGGASAEGTSKGGALSGALSGAFGGALGGASSSTTTTDPALEGIPGGLKEPPDSLELGNSSWTLLHSVAAYYPLRPSATQKQEMQQFLTTFSHFYPCRSCAKDFEHYIGEHKPNVESRSDLSLWMCDAHNAVNTKLGKPTFDCKYWQARWKEGWDDFLKSQK